MEAEIPFVLYLLFGELGAGSFWTAVIAEYRGVRSEISRRCCITAFILMILAGISVVMHLTHPEHGIYGLSNLGTSWLSRDTLLILLLGLLTLIYILQSKFGLPGRTPVGFIGALVGLVFVISTGMAHVLPARPAWNTFLIPLMDVVSAAVLGTFVFATFSTGRDLPEQSFRNLCKAAGIALIVQIIVEAGYLGYLSGVPEVSLAELIYGGLGPFFWMRVILGFVVPLIFVGVYLTKGEGAISRKTLAITCLLYVVAGALIDISLVHLISEPVTLFRPEEILGGV